MKHMQAIGGKKLVVVYMSFDFRIGKI